MLVIFSDGGARGNPGHAASAFATYNEAGELIHSDSKYLGKTTNNVAEYNGVILALEWLTKERQEKEIKFCMDSELVVKQLTGVYRIKNKILADLAAQVISIIKENDLSVNFVHIPRKENSYADKLVNEKLDDSSRL